MNSHYLQKVIIRTPVVNLVILMWTSLVFIFLISVCDTIPTRQMSPHIPISEKIPLKAAIISPVSMYQKFWQPPYKVFWSYAYRPQPTGKILAETSQEAMNFVFDEVFIVSNEEEARWRGANIFIAVDSSTDSYERPDATVETIIHLSLKCPDNAILPISERATVKIGTFGTINEVLVRNSMVDAFERIIPRLLSNQKLRSYVTGPPIDRPPKKEELRTHEKKPAHAVSEEMTETGEILGKVVVVDGKTVTQVSQPTVTIDDLFLSEQSNPDRPIRDVKPGQKLNMVIRYNISGVPGEEISGYVQVFHQGMKIVNEQFPITPKSKGTYDAIVPFTVPQNADSGEYKFQGLIRLGEKEISKSFKFHIL